MRRAADGMPDMGLSTGAVRAGGGIARPRAGGGARCRIDDTRGAGGAGAPGSTPDHG
ncbi:hypothetical protein GCM10018987_41970 [Streptomyces cremeus]